MVNKKLVWNRENKLNKLLSFLNREKEATFAQLQACLKVSQPTLAEYVKTLEKDEKIEHFDKSEDRRNTWYRIKPQSKQIVEADLGRYEATQFIESLTNPIYIIERRGNYAVSLFAQWDKVKDREKTEEMLRKTVSTLAEIFSVQPSLEKQALVVTNNPEKIDNEPREHASVKNKGAVA